MWEDLKDLFVPLMACGVIAAIVLGGILLFANWYGSYACSNYQEITGKKTRWVFLDECYIETDQGMQRWDEYKKRVIASDGLSRLAEGE